MSAVRSRTRLDLVLAVAFGVIGTILFFVAGSSRVMTNDVYSASLGSWRIATTGSPSLEGLDLGALPDLPSSPLWTTRSGDGDLVVDRSPGVVAAGVPAYAVARLLGGSGTDAQDFSVLPARITAACLVGAALGLLYLTLCGLISRAIASSAVLIFGFATPMWTVAGSGLWTHSVTVLGLSGMIWNARRDRWWWAGVFGGVALCGRLHVALIVAVLGLVVAATRRQPTIALRVAVTSGVGMALASLWGQWVYGSWNPGGAYHPTAYLAATDDTGLLAHLINEAGLLISPDKGALVWTPLLVLLAPAVARNWRNLPDWVRATVIGGLLYLVVQGLLSTGFTGGSGLYGYRLSLETLTCVLPAYALSVPAMGRVARVLAAPMVGLQVGVLLPGVFLHGAFVPIDQAWTDNAFAVVVRSAPATLLLPVVVVLIATMIGRILASGARGRTPDRSPKSAAEAG